MLAWMHSCTCLPLCRIKVSGHQERRSCWHWWLWWRQSKTHYSCWTNGSRVHRLSVIAAPLRACPCLLLSFNKHKIPQQVFLRTCEADEGCLGAHGCETEIKMKIKFCHDWGEFLNILCISPCINLQGFVQAYPLFPAQATKRACTNIS